MKRQSKNDSELADLGRFSEPALLVLISLAEGPKHGYAIGEDVFGISGMRLGPGTLYGAISRLESRKFIEALEPNERRIPYRLTAHGVTLLRARLTNLERVARVGSERLASA